MTDKKKSRAQLWQKLKAYMTLNIENAKLTVAEKVTVLVTAAAISVVAMQFAVIILFFVSVALAALLEKVLDPWWAYLIIAGAYAIIFVALYLLRKPLIMDPVSRFITRLFFNP